MVGESDPQPHTLQRVLGHHSGGVAALKFAPDESSYMLASASADKTVRVWDTRTDAYLASLSGHTQGISDIAWTHDSRFIASGSDDRTIRIWDVERHQEVNNLKGHESYVFCLCTTPHSQILISGSYDEHVRVWDMRAGRCVSTIEAHSDPVTALDAHKDGHQFVSGSHDGLLRVWDVRNAQCLRTIFADGNPPISSVKYAPNGKYVLSGTLDSCIRLWQAGPTAMCIKQYRGHENSRYCISTGFSVTGEKYIVSGSEDARIYLWKLNSKELVGKLEGHTAAVLALALHPTRNTIASGGTNGDNSIRLWHAAGSSLP